MNSYPTRLHSAIRQKGTPALVGLDPRWQLLPEAIRTGAEARSNDPLAARAFAYEEFCKRVIDVVAPLVPAVKPQSAFFEECGPAGVAALRNVIRAARDVGLLVICDAKRGDIGSTAQAYAAAYLAGEDPDAAPFAADALTVNPYMGTDTLGPFIDRATEVGAGLYVLVRTSNPGAGDFQDLLVREPSGPDDDAEPVFRRVAMRIEQLSRDTIPPDEGSYGLVGAVVGATWPRELAELREAMPHVPLLIPGYGSQGGTARDVAAAFDDAGLGALVNSSRGILFAYRSGDLAETCGEAAWEEAVRTATERMIADLAMNES
jgi:orotidine-5'-phosphate decarboxylase